MPEQLRMPSEDEADRWWLVDPNARFVGCAPQEESTQARVAIDKTGRSQIRCDRCGSPTALVFRDERFHCRDRVGCDATVAKTRRTGSRYSR